MDLRQEKEEGFPITSDPGLNFLLSGVVRGGLEEAA